MASDIKERTFAFAARVVRLCQMLDAAPGVSRTMADQLLRSGTSVGANVEEAHGSQSKTDFTAKMYIACKEARETHYWLRLLIATDIVPEGKLAPMLDESNQLVAILTSIAKTAKNGRNHDA
ncbi:MAG: four helix bundle protein [Proteobacteria bacterium]|nr:four helix bundle protein [Pseudomonadota bacterium]MBS0461522.1 four helix bundle protein [Pseudomonadota bacterium]